MKQKQEIEEELSSITPILESAKIAVGGIKNDNLTEIRSLKMPPEPISDVLSAVLLLLGILDTSWLSMRKFLGNRGVKEEILNFDARRITKEMRTAVSKLLKQKGSSFEHANIYRVSVAAAPLAAWVKANIRYSLVLEKIEPLEEQLNEAKQALDAAQQRLDECEAELKEIDDKVSVLKTEFKNRTTEAERLKVTLERAEMTLEKAENLIGKLGGEKTRWAKQAGDLEVKVKTLPLEMLLAAGFTTFLAKEPEDVRASVLADWEEFIVCKTKFNYMKVMTTESELLKWKAIGLPSDNLSMENGLVVHNSPDRCPFIIDPANASVAWLEAHLSTDKVRPLSVVASQDPRFTSLVEQAVRFGKTLLVLDVDGIEPLLYPLVRRDLSNEGARKVVQVGDKQLDYNENFRIYLVTRNPNPDLPPDAKSLITEVNFTVTKAGLEGQLLGTTILHEQPELEKQKSELLRQEEEFKVQLATLEKDLLQALATSSGDILENVELIDTLTKTKEKSTEIGEALQQSAESSEELDRQREKYKPFSQKGSKLYFLMTMLKNINPMYQFSLASFLGIFKQTLNIDNLGSKSVDKISALGPILETKLLYFVGRSLFKDDRMMWSLHLVQGMHPEEFGDKEWSFFVGDLVPEIDDTRPKDFPAWASHDRVSMFRLFTSTFPRLTQTLGFKDADMWTRWGKSPECDKDFPPTVASNVTPFQKVLVVQTLRPDRLQSALSNFVCEVLNITTVSPPSVHLPELHKKESHPKTPILMIVSSGADPSKELEDFAEQTIGKLQYESLPMGGGQQDVALQMLREASDKGKWLCLKNLHLVVAFLPTLEKIFNTMQPHENFLLWLTTESHPKFPPILLQQSLKITFESPPGLKKNLQRTYTNWGAAFVERGNIVRSQLLFLLAWYHALIQERRTYMPQGWVKFYEFSFGDLRAGTNIMDNPPYVGSSDKPDWHTIHGLLDNAIYGGRVDDPYDLRVLMTYLKLFFSSTVLQGRGDPQYFAGVDFPSTNVYADYMETIQQLPDTDVPSTFGLPDNVERSVQRARSAAVVSALRTLMRSTQEGARFDRKTWKKELGPIVELWERITKHSPESTSKPAKQDISKMLPVDAFVVMENEMGFDLVVYIDGCLNALKKVIFGTGMLTPAIQAMGSALLKGQTPPTWEKRWLGSEKPQVWLRAVVKRKVALSQWVSRVNKGSLLDNVLHLDDLYNPATFLNALRQQTARVSKSSMDTLKLVSQWGKGAKIRNAVLSMTVGGLSLQGAAFEGETLSECHSSASELSPVEAVTVAFVQRNEPSAYPEDSCIGLPLYLTMTREVLLVELDTPTKPNDKDRWIMAGCALFLSDDE